MPPLYVNTYFYYDENTNDACVIDPSGSISKLMDIINENDLNLKFILITHGHYDHIGAVNELKDKTGAQILAHSEEDALLKNPAINLSTLGIGRSISIVCDKLLTDGDTIEFGAGKLFVIHTPGHTAGGACFYDEENAVLFSGDTLFKGTTGRYDLPTSNGPALFSSIKDKLFTLPSEVKVFPGHEAATTIGEEKSNNSILRR